MKINSHSKADKVIRTLQRMLRKEKFKKNLVLSSFSFSAFKIIFLLVSVIPQGKSENSQSS